VAAAAYQAQKVSGGNGEDCNDDDNPPNITPDFLENKVPIELLPLEQSLSMLEWPIVTVSFYTFSNNNDMEEVFGRIEKRVQAILAANPWLGCCSLWFFVCMFLILATTSTINLKYYICRFLIHKLIYDIFAKGICWDELSN